jgi:hypothetical protein
MDLLKPYSSITMNVKVDNGADETLTCASSGKCQVKYSWSYTPRWSEMSPAVLYPGMMSTIFVNPKYCGNYRKDDEPMLDWRVGGAMVDMTGYMDEFTTLYNRVNYVKGKIMTEERSLDADVRALFHGCGFSHRDDGDGHRCNVDQSDCYTVRVHPTIESISQAGGYTSGGQKLRLTGTSLDGATITVMVDDTPCNVLDEGHTDHEMFCETWPKLGDLEPPKPYYAGEHGLHRSSYNNTDPRANADNLDDLEDQGNFTIMTSFEIA